MDEIEFWASGIPAPGGSKRGFHNPKTGRTLIVEANPEKNRNWRAVVSLAATEAMQKRPLFEGALLCRMEFFMPRPKNHYGKGGVLRLSAPRWHTSKPDLTKLIRSTEDALTQVVWKDDAVIVHSVGYKKYSDAQAGVAITVKSVIF